MFASTVIRHLFCHAPAAVHKSSDRYSYIHNAATFAMLPADGALLTLRPTRESLLAVRPMVESTREQYGSQIKYIARRKATVRRSDFGSMRAKYFCAWVQKENVWWSSALVLQTSTLCHKNVKIFVAIATGIGRWQIWMTSLNWLTPKTPVLYNNLLYIPSYSEFCIQIAIDNRFKWTIKFVDPKTPFGARISKLSPVKTEL